MQDTPFKKTYYLYNTDNKSLAGNIVVRVIGQRSLNPATGKQEYDKSRAVNVAFKFGEYMCTDPDIASFLDVYHDGGEWTWRGQKMYKSPETFAAFRISSKMLLPDGIKMVKEVVTKTAIPEFIASGLSAEQLRMACESFDVPFSDIMSKQDLLDALKKNGNLA